MLGCLSLLILELVLWKLLQRAQPSKFRLNINHDFHKIPEGKLCDTFHSNLSRKKGNVCSTAFFFLNGLHDLTGGWHV